MALPSFRAPAVGLSKSVAQKLHGLTWTLIIFIPLPPIWTHQAKSSIYSVHRMSWISGTVISADGNLKHYSKYSTHPVLHFIIKLSTRELLERILKTYLPATIFPQNEVIVECRRTLQMKYFYKSPEMLHIRFYCVWFCPGYIISFSGLLWCAYHILQGCFVNF